MMTQTTPPRVTIVVRDTGGSPMRQCDMTGTELQIGRDEGDVRIEDDLVSPRHAAIELDEAGWPQLRDLGSSLGTFLNARLVAGPTPLQDGDEIRIGPAHLVVRIASGG